MALARYGSGPKTRQAALVAFETLIMLLNEPNLHEAIEETVSPSKRNQKKHNISSLELRDFQCRASRSSPPRIPER